MCICDNIAEDHKCFSLRSSHRCDFYSELRDSGRCIRCQLKTEQTRFGVHQALAIAGLAERYSHPVLVTLVWTD